MTPEFEGERATNNEDRETEEAPLDAQLETSDPVSAEVNAPTAWSQEAADMAAELAGEVDRLEAVFQTATAGGPFKPFWDRARAVNERMRTAQPITLDDKLALQHRITHLCERARAAQSERRAVSDETRRALEESIQLAVEALADVATAADVQQVRADLALVRERLDASRTELDRTARQAVWQRWQAANQAAWQALQERWQANAAALTPLLEQAESALEAGRPRDAREAIKSFRLAVASNEISRQTLRDLQRRADGLWNRASTLSQERHQQFLQHTGRRIDGWRAALVRQHHARERLARETEVALRRASSAATDVAAALLRGQASELQRQLDRLDAQIRDLEERIRHAEETLARG